MVGARDILVQIGYSETSPSAMQFPESVKEPNKEKLHIIAAELLMAKLEAENLPYSSISRQSSTSSTGTSTPGTPNSSHLLQQQTSQAGPQGGPQNSHHHVVPTTSYMYSSHVTPPGNTGPVITDVLRQPHSPIRPTEPFTPTGYEVPPHTAPSTPQYVTRLSNSMY